MAGEPPTPPGVFCYARALVKLRAWRRALLGVATTVAAIAGSGGGIAADDAASRGAYLVRAGGCVTCHTAKGGPQFAGGRALKTPFGTFYSPNITPDPETGIGRWTNANFVRALRSGITPDGSHYFPAFPFTSYTGLTYDDAIAIKAHLFSLAPVSNPNRDHELIPPFGWRFLQWFWKLLFFEDGTFEPNPDQSAQWNRGAYLVTALAHCSECHTPRNVMGAPKRSLYLAGTVDGPEGELVPNITPHEETGIGRWSEADLVFLFKNAVNTDFQLVGGSMGLVIRDGLEHLSDDDLEAIAVYLKSVPPVVNKVERPKR